MRLDDWTTLYVELHLTQHWIFFPSIPCKNSLFTLKKILWKKFSNCFIVLPTSFRDYMTEASGESCNLDPKSPFLANSLEQKDWEGIGWKKRQTLFFLVMDPFSPPIVCSWHHPLRVTTVSYTGIFGRNPEICTFAKQWLFFLVMAPCTHFTT